MKNDNRIDLMTVMGMNRAQRRALGKVNGRKFGGSQVPYRKPVKT